MAMHVDTSKCSPEAAIRTSEGIQYHVGLMLMVLGQREITEKNLDEVLCRLTYYFGLRNGGRSAERDADARWYVNHIRNSVGVKINGVNETWAKFAKRMSDAHKRFWKDDWKDVLDTQSSL